MKENDLKNQCLYCGNDLSNNRWISDFKEGFHYKITLCNCGKCQSFRETNTISSGHDDWDGKWLSLNEYNKLKNNIKKKTLEKITSSAF
jgi:hypothetical protein